MSQQFPAVVIIAPLITSFSIFLSGWWFKRYAYLLALAALIVCFFCSLAIFNSVLDHGTISYWLGGWPPPWGIEYRIDLLNALMLCLITFLALLAAIYARKPVEKELPEKTTLFWSLYLLLITGLLGIIVTGDLFNLFVLLEVASLTGYALVAVGPGRAPVSSFRYLIIGTVGASLYLLGVGYLYISTGSLNMADLKEMLPALYGSRVVKAAFVFIFIGFAIKIALFPLHAWQPDAYTHAPSAVSVILSTAAAKTFCYALIRIIFSVFTLEFVTTFLPIFEIICWLAAISIITGSVLAIGQDNLKRMLAYSSVANVGYIVLAIGLAPSTQLGLIPAIMHLINHALIKGAMFMAACAFIYQNGLWNIRNFTGLGRKMPYSSLVLIVAALSMIGLPPGAGFVSKWYLILAALDAGKYLFVAVIFISTLLMIVYFWRVIEIMYIRPGKAEENPSSRIGEIPPSMLVPCLVLGALSFLVGLLWISGTLTPLLQTINSGFGMGGAT